MEKKLARIVSLFDSKTEELLVGLNLDNENLKSAESNNNQDEEIRLPAHDLWSRNHPFVQGLTCRQCGAAFDSVFDQRQHFKSDWHVENLKRKLANLTILTENEHDESIKQDSAIDSDANEEDEDNEGNIVDDSILEKRDGSPYLWFRNSNGNLISIHRVLLSARKETTTSELISNRFHQLLSRKNHQLVSILMIDSCRFAGAVFQGEKVLVHKRLRYYTVRAQSGTRQSAHDSKCNRLKRSVGANIRRANEASLINNTQNLLISWSDQITRSNLIFIRCPPTQKFVIFGGKEPILNKGSYAYLVQDMMRGLDIFRLQQGHLLPRK
ncbi:Ankyrin repeat and zinc finger domain-containing protein 1 [Trichoplax sp. H2]|nr:Ankyrin repeat and zinc finger domain-containing protein 1 [Trichoplax sp. H2]|eukprot:RDD40434.1 Ankyrin repeat and zinc finger domain-containing protein 1 [Trichoplax sp. H2]